MFVPEAEVAGLSKAEVADSGGVVVTGVVAEGRRLFLSSTQRRRRDVKRTLRHHHRRVWFATAMASKSKFGARDSSNHQKKDSSGGKEPVDSVAGGSGAAAVDLNDPDLLLPSVLPFKKTQLTDRYPKGQTRGRHWKHLKQIIQAENYHTYPADEPTYVSIEAPPSMYPAKKYCDITGFEAPYTDPRTKLRYANTEVFKFIRSLPEDTIQGYLALRNAAVVLK